jgi:hypothetical protein|tara:strand:+ start:80 stop:427 length:348 start_codon:yes stop_codon:yes gene_type:complete
MSKFLNLVEDHRPEKDIDELTSAKRSLQRLLLKSKIEAHGIAFQDIIRVRLDDGRVVELEVKDVQRPEDNEMLDKEFENKAKSDQRYAKALKDREDALNKKLIDFEKETQEIETS